MSVSGRTGYNPFSLPLPLAHWAWRISRRTGEGEGCRVRSPTPITRVRTNRSFQRTGFCSFSSGRCHHHPLLCQARSSAEKTQTRCSLGCCLSKERLRGLAGPANQPTPTSMLPPLEEQRREGDPATRSSLLTGCPPRAPRNEACTGAALTAVGQDRDTASVKVLLCDSANRCPSLSL